jgi:hypothetical protein
MTYQEVAQNLIHLYANYVDVCVANDEEWSDYCEEIAIAVEALLIRADNERMLTAQKEYLTNLASVATMPSDQTMKLLQDDIFEKHFGVRDI